MKRTCQKVIISANSKKAIYVDTTNKKQILSYINRDNRHKDKFRFFADIFLAGIRNGKIYKKEEINKNCKNVYAIRFFVGQENDRIYCKEISDKTGTHITVMAILLELKSSTELSSREISEIEKVGRYIYEV